MRRADTMDNLSSNRRDRRSGAPLQSPPTVLYLCRASSDVPPMLDAEHGMEVHAVSERAAVTATLDEQSIDCVIVEGTCPEDADGLLAALDERRSTPPVLAYDQSDGDPRRWFRAGADDYLSGRTDTERRTLLARRIERCVASRRIRTDCRRFRTAVDGMGLPFLIADPNGRIEHVNRAFETILGEDRRALVGRPVSALGTAIDDDWGSITDGDPWEGELVVDGAGETRRIDLRVRSVRDDDGRTERIVATGTERSAPGAEDRKCDGRRRKYRELIDAAPDAIIVADTDTGIIVEANEAATSLIGRPRGEIIGMHQSALHPDGDRERYRHLFDRHQRHDESVRRRFDDDPIHVETAGGDRIPVEINARVVELDGQTFLQGHFRDISEHRDRERKLRTILDAVPDVAIVYDESGTYEDVLSGAEDLLVDSPDALEGLAVHDVLPPEPANQICEAIRETIEAGETQNLEYRLPLDGDTHHFSARISPLRTEGSESERVLCLARDITARKRREQDLRSFRQAVEQAGHAIMITDTDGSIEYVNPEFESVTGYTKAEVTGETPAILNSGEHDERYYQDLWETILGGEIWEGELVNQRKEGERYHVEQTIAPITDETGDIERFVAINTDITERKQYEYQLERERDRLEEFARTVAHDLRNPLSIALGHVDMARQGDESVDASLDRALSALERMEAMIEEVLELSKQGEIVHETDPVSFERIVDLAWEHVDTDTATRRIADDLHGWTLPADESRLRQLLENLLGNAVKHAGPGVTIRLGRLSGREGFFIEDDGPGIEPSARNRIFESGFTSAADGTGFGLAIAKQIVDAHGWSIDVTDAEDNTGGGRFEITTTYHEHAVDKEWR
ncbi:PAS domain S-box protein [Haloplanus rubicundus]|uniref:histidine kinase n=2 Tax=Haloplanus rubicundus TaxID=1547898 RepID=A0A345EDD3_9EURY|nr:PAS domain S-box protein [Haloplanus rubicundus]